MTTYPLQANQPEHVRRLQSEAMGAEIVEFTVLPPILANPPAKPAAKL
jgi:hypothetical protein